MTSEERFEPRLGRMRSITAKAPKSFRSCVIGAVQRAGGFKRAGKSATKSSGTYGRGAGVGRLLTASATRGRTARRVVVKARFVRLAGKGLRAAAAHLAYLQRDGVTREGARGVLYGPQADRIEASDFMGRCDGDRHQFRFIVAPEDAHLYDDLKPLTRKVMQQMEADLGTRLDWAAVDHFNTGHPHTHIVLRGRDDRGKDLVIAREYLSEGFRERVQAQVSLDLGPRSEREIALALQAEVSQERLTSIDRQLRREADDQGHVVAGHSDPAMSAARAGRLVKLQALGLAEKASGGRWRLDPEMETTLRQMGERGDIIKTLHRALTDRGLEATLSEAQMHLPSAPSPVPVGALTGRLIERGILEEQSDRHYVILEGMDGRTHFVDIGQGAATEALPKEAVLQVTPRRPEIREVDRTVLTVAQANGGYYTIEIHLMFDPTARRPFAETHARRLEAIRRTTGAIDRLPDGRFRIDPDYLDKALAYERKDVARLPVSITVQASRTLDKLVSYKGVTWLDRQWVAGPSTECARTGFGEALRVALQARRQWLLEEGLWMPVTGPGAETLDRSVLKTLHQREMTEVAVGLEANTGKSCRTVPRGGLVEGRLREIIATESEKYAVVERAKDFALVPWRPVLDKHIGQEVSGLMREGGINWTICRARGLEID
ncbi:relaxase/mobilization nuclease RlxS [Asticcacaulis sp. DXS10W]|uniref:Relaxase/mobilization nuclease RlxS n=1 Tax=Asticcacaulis currens TaxID=2984210 RepID=A0ABT5IDE6_9CAUL|nr:relaxase/mobilization nuclease RlxS [Asticcacaulis currens]MDC7693491.1 relaxase/mobilization nuclease RlxS [Asticcacaulis currens]